LATRRVAAEIRFDRNKLHVETNSMWMSHPSRMCL
jgi:hypothetical protein